MSKISISSYWLLNMGLKELRILYEKGQYKELLDRLTPDQISSLASNEQVECFYYQSRALVRLGQYQQALDTVVHAYSSISDPSDKILVLALLIAQIYPLISLGQIEEALAISEEGDTICDSLTTEDQTRGATWIAAFLQAKGIISGRKGDFITALQYCQDSLALRKSLGNSQGVAETLRQIGGIY